MATRTILSIDGGGIRGLIPAKFLEALEARCGKPVAELFDYVAGTSTGGILALGLTKPNASNTGPEFAARDLVDLYERNGGTIFSRSVRHTIEAVGNLKGPKFAADGIEEVLQRYFGNARLADARAKVLVTAYDIERRMPFFFRSTRAVEKPLYDFPMWQVARATSAAPTYFPPFQLSSGSDQYGLIDGGVYANNPALCVYVDALTQNQAVDDFIVVSVGTGNSDRRIPYAEAAHWGLPFWAHPLFDIISDGVSDTVDYQLKQLLPARDGAQRYYRFQTDIPDANQEIDDVRVETIRTLKVVAERLVADSESTLVELGARLTSAKASRA
ncbi:MAG TPA: patatin-like phospholipase family protein [Polyangiaceae bacterium]|nr:patatin-like phospholipase family protein [Polyangiaceae bacterium]